MARVAIGSILSIIGAGVGSALGYLLFRWAYDQNLYAMIVPGAGLGLGAHLAALDRSRVRGGVMGVAALMLGLLVEWEFFPFVADDSLAYFIQHIPRIVPMHLLMIAVGGVFGYWWGKEASPWSRVLAKSLKVERGVES
jgi:hypothetical protein